MLCTLVGGSSSSAIGGGICGSRGRCIGSEVYLLLVLLVGVCGVQGAVVVTGVLPPNTPDQLLTEDDNPDNKIPFEAVFQGKY